MNNKLLIFRHYMRRALLEPIGISILTVLPVALIIILNMIYTENMSATEITLNGYNMVSSHLAAVMFVMFQLFGGSYMLDWLYLDFKSPRRWRLLSAPCRLNTYILSAGFASWVFSMIQGILVLSVSALFLNAYLGNLFVLVCVLITVSAMGQFLHILLFLLTKTKPTAEGASQLIIQGMMFISVWMANFYTTDNPVVNFFYEVGTPIALARRAIEYSGFIGNDMVVAMQSLGVLTGLTLLLFGAVLFVGRRRSF